MLPPAGSRPVLVDYGISVCYDASSLHEEHASGRFEIAWALIRLTLRSLVAECSIHQVSEAAELGRFVPTEGKVSFAFDEVGGSPSFPVIVVITIESHFAY